MVPAHSGCPLVQRKRPFWCPDCHSLLAGSETFCLSKPSTPDKGAAVSAQPVDPGTPREQSAGQPEINDPPIERDPIGQALIGLPFAIATGVGEAAVEGAGLVGELGKEVLSWGAAELGIGAGEDLLDASHTHADQPADASGGLGPPVSPDASGQGTPEDEGVCEDPGYTPADMPPE